MLSSPGSSLSPPATPAAKWRLVVRAFAARNLGYEASRRKRSVALRITLGNGTSRETEFVEIVNGKAKWNSFFEFVCDSRPADSVLEISLVRIAFLPIPMHRHTAFTRALVACGSFPNDDETAGWFPMASLKEEVRLSIFWTQEPATAEHGNSRGDLSFGLGSDSWSWKRRAPSSSSVPTVVHVSSQDLLFKKLPDKAVLLKPQHRVDDVGVGGGDELLLDDNFTNACVVRPKLEIEVVQARNLLAVNRFTFNSSSDPFALVTCRGTKRETEVIKHTLNPLWTQGKFEFGALEDLQVTGGAVDEVRICIKDWDRLGKYVDLGEVAIRLDQIAMLPSSPTWFPLLPTIYMKPGNRDLGEVQLRLELFVPEPPPPQQFRLGSRQNSSPLRRAASTASVLPTPTAAATLAATSSSLLVDSARPSLVLKIIQARGLLAMDFGGVSDPYCVVHLKTQTKRTSTVSKTLSPLWDFEYTFGEHDLLGMNDELRIDIFDNDSVLSDLMDDKLGTVRIPLWSVYQADLTIPQWYTIESVPSSDHQCAGEIQLAMSYTNPHANRMDIFKGKVWMLELQVGVLEYRGITPFSKPHCIVALSNGGSTKRAKKFKSKSATNLIWPPERFIFNGQAENGGVVDTDVLTITMMERRLVVGKLQLDVAHMIDRMGYFDAQGQSFTAWFDMKAEDQRGGGRGLRQDPAMVDGEEEEEEDGDTQDGDNEEDDAASAVTREPYSYRAGEGLLSSSSPNGFRGTIQHALGSPFRAVSGHREASSVYSERYLSQLAAHPPSIKLLIRLLPKGEKRCRVSKKLVVRVDQLTKQFTIPQSLSELPLMVYCRCKIGCYVRESPPVLFHGNVLQGNPRFHASFYFQDEIEWIMNEAAKRLAARERNLRRRRGSLLSHPTLTSNGSTRLFDSGPCPNDQIMISILDAASHQVLYDSQTSFVDLGLLPKTEVNEWTSSLLPCVTVGIATEQTTTTAAALHTAFKIVDVKEEMIPLLGHIHLQLVQFKTVNLSFHVDHALRFVIKYSDLIFPSALFVGDPCPVLISKDHPESVRFPIYDMFQTITIEVYVTSIKPGGGVEISLPNPPAPLQLLLKKIRNARNKVVDLESKPLASKWGTLLGSCTLSLFDLYEIEARTVFEEDRGSTCAMEKAFKMPIMDSNKAIRGTLYLEARCTENGGFGGILAANPHPFISPEEIKPFSLVNLRYEMVRLVKILNWMSNFMNHINSLLDWESPKKTASGILVCVVLTCADWFAAHWLLLFPSLILIHMINRHRKRMNGQFESEFDLSTSANVKEKASISTHVRMAMLSCRMNGEEDVGLIFARLCVLDHPKSSDIRKLGSSGLSAFDSSRAVQERDEGESLPWNKMQANLAETKLGYSLQQSKSHRPNLQMWKFKDTLPAVPAFDFIMENCTIAENTMIIIKLSSARCLISRDSNGKSDPYVRLTLKDISTGKDERQRSKTKPRTLNPVWNTRFMFGDGMKPISTKSILVIQVFDADNTQDQDLGGMELSLQDWFEACAGGGYKWIKLSSPRDLPDTDAGEICVKVEWFSIQSRFHGADVTGEGDGQGFTSKPLSALMPTDLEQEGEEEDKNDTVVASWKRCGSMVGVEIVNRKNQILGTSLLPLGEFVKSDGVRVQPCVDVCVKLEGGTNGDSGIEVKFKIQLTLPDPKAQEIRAQMNEAKRADSLNPAKKYSLVMSNLASAQTQLAALNNRAERLKNLFNYTHPRRSDLVFNLLVFHCVLFIIMPTRVYLLLAILFFFTEKFRPMGTMGVRFKHLLSQLPTDDDLRVVLQGPAYTHKRKLMQIVAQQEEDKNGEDEDEFFEVNQDDNVASKPPRLIAASGPSRSFRVRTKFLRFTESSNSDLQAVSGADALFSGSLSYAKIRPNGLSAFERKFFVVTGIGMHGWGDRELASLSNQSAAMHVLRINQVTCVLPSVVTNETELKRHNCMFVVYTDRDGEFLFLASTPHKQAGWIEALEHFVGGGGE
ncbi:hypothetical protein BASA81_005444 [Batrachochytrium salamandrivorans]|nr:hypothetical protein BASA81_005444 [Batrachochytrium salamandrivorans]